MSTFNFTWTDEAVQTLRERFSAGDSYQQIARKLGCTRNAVLGKSHRIGLSRGDASDSRAKSAAAVRAAHASLATVVRNHAARKPDKPLPAPKGGLIATATIHDLNMHTCRWPIGDPIHPGFGFCGRHTEAGPYCATHRKIATGAPATQAQREAAARAREARTRGRKTA